MIGIFRRTCRGSTTWNEAAIDQWLLATDKNSFWPFFVLPQIKAGPTVRTHTLLISARKRLSFHNRCLWKYTQHHAWHAWIFIASRSFVDPCKDALPNGAQIKPTVYKCEWKCKRQLAFAVSLRVFAYTQRKMFYFLLHICNHPSVGVACSGTLSILVYRCWQST